MIDYSDRLTLAAALKTAGIEPLPDVRDDVPEIRADPLDHALARLQSPVVPDVLSHVR